MRDYKAFLKEGKDEFSPVAYAKVKFWEQFNETFKKYGVESPDDGRLIMYVDTEKPVPFFDCDLDAWKKEVEAWLKDTEIIDRLITDLPKGTKLQNGFNKRGFFIEICNTEKELENIK